MTIKGGEGIDGNLFGGFKQQIDLIKEVIGLKLINRDTQNVKIRGILLHGPSGIGKTMAIDNVLGPMENLNKILISPKHLVQVTYYHFIFI